MTHRRIAVLLIALTIVGLAVGCARRSVGPAASNQPAATATAPADQSLPGEQVSVEDIPALNGVRVFYYTPDDSVQQLLAIAEQFKGKYSDKATMEILFFNDRQNTPQALPMNDYGIACHVAKFEWTPSQGRQVLQRKADGWKEVNQGL